MTTPPSYMEATQPAPTQHTEMTDSELDMFFNDLTECLGPQFTDASTAAAYGETILLSVYDVCTRRDKHFVLYSRQPLTNMLCL